MFSFKKVAVMILASVLAFYVGYGRAESVLTSIFHDNELKNNT
jgi:hypothetical protein